MAFWRKKSLFSSLFVSFGATSMQKNASGERKRRARLGQWKGKTRQNFVPFDCASRASQIQWANMQKC